MIFEEKLLEEITKYCIIKNIPIKNGKIPVFYEREINGYIRERLEKERGVTRRSEENIQLRMDYSIQNIITKLLVGIKIESPLEEYLWDALEKEELSYLAKKQFEIGKYKIDIAFPVAKLAIECDGAEYHRSNIQQLERDQKRDIYLARKGWRTMRFAGIEIRRDIKFCIKKIKEAINLKIN